MAAALCRKRDIAARYQIGIRTLDRWIAKRIIPVIRVSPRCIRFDPEQCDVALRRLVIDEATKP
jgi:hypothetical protein